MGLVNNRGHGALGIRARMRDFVSLIDTSETEKTVIVELQPVQEIQSWAPDQGGAFVASVDFSFDGVRRDIIDVRSLINPTLRRVETLDQVRTQEGTFFYDPEQSFTASGTWDDGFTEWDDGLSRWDQFTQLFVHLTNDIDPDETTIVAVHSFGFAPKGMVQPQFGPRKLLNGDFENFTDGQADFWEIFEGSGFTEWDDGSTTWDDGSTTWDELLQAIFEATSPFNVREGDSALGMAVAGGGITSIRQNLDQPDEFTVGKIYRFYGAYKTQGDTTAQIVISSDLDAPGDSLFEDGRSLDPATNHFIDLSGTGGEYRRFAIDFIAFGTSHEFLLRAVSGGGAGEVFWDDVDVRRIWSYKYFEPRVQMSAIPETRSGTHDVFFGRKNVGVGSVRLVNSNGGDFDRGYFYELVPKLEWMNQNCIVRWGGEFPPLAPGDESQEILLEDFENAFVGLIQSQNLNTEQYEMGLQDLRSFFHATIPIALYDVGQFSDMDPRLQGQVRPLLFGRKENINPPRIRLSVGNYGVYEIADPTDAPNGIFRVETVFAYDNNEAASSLDAASRITLVDGTDYTVDLDAGTISIINDVGPFVVTTENNIIEWQDGPIPIHEGFVPVGRYTATQLAAAIEQTMEPVTGNDYSVTYDQLTHEFTIERLSGAGVFSLATNFGDDKDIAIWPLIGFDKNGDKTGFLLYTSDEPVFTDVDQDHIIRTDAQGFKDDNFGTFTGIGESLINIGADILRVIIQNYMKKSEDVIDQDSFEDARTGTPEELAVYFGKPVSTKEIFDALEFSNAASITVNADGIVFYKVDIADVKKPPPLVDDKDIEEHVEEFEVADVYQTIRIAFDQDPSTGDFEAVEATDSSVVPRLGRPDTRTFETFLKNRTDAQTRADFFLDLANTPPRKIVLNLLGGRFIRFDIGDKIDLSIDRATGVDGQIVNKIMRIVSIRKRPQDGKVNMEVTDNVPT